MVRGHVVEIAPDKKLRNRGDHEFVQLPSPGDRIVVGNDSGDLEMVRVLRIKHVPVAVPHARRDHNGAIARIYVEWVEKWNETE